MLVSADKKAPPLKVFEFNNRTVPTKRHKLIQDFQSSTVAGPRIFIVTYATAAVGITLTAANRVYRAFTSMGRSNTHMDRRKN